MLDKAAGYINPFALRLGAAICFCGLAVNCGIDDVGIVFGFDDVAAFKVTLLRFPLKLLKFACVNGDGPGESPPDESSDSAPDSEPEFSSCKEKKKRRNFFKKKFII